MGPGILTAVLWTRNSTQSHSTNHCFPVAPGEVVPHFGSLPLVSLQEQQLAKADPPGARLQGDTRMLAREVGWLITWMWDAGPRRVRTQEEEFLTESLFTGLGGLGGDSRNQGGYTDSWPLHGPLAGRSSGAAVTSPLQNPAPHTPAGGRISVCLCLSPRVRRSGSA